MKSRAVRWFIIGLLLAGALAWNCSQAAGLFVQAGIGESIAIPKNTDGTWFDEDRPHQFHTNSVAFRFGAGWQFNERWSVEASYINLGKNGVDSLAVSDDCFSRQCTDETPSKFHVVDKVHGFELAGVYTFQTQPVQPYLRAGGFLARHNLHVDVTPPVGAAQHVDFSGRITGIVLGAGIKWKWLFTEINYYHGAGGSAAPVSRSFIVPTVGGRYEF
jgi:hypothetical protein